MHSQLTSPAHEHVDCRGSAATGRGQDGRSSDNWEVGALTPDLPRFPKPLDRMVRLGLASTRHRQQGPEQQEKPVTVCPYCDWTPKTGDPGRRVHILTFHRDRLAASLAYNAALASGKTEAEARAVYNARIYKTGPGQYDRGVLRGGAV